MYSPGRNKKKKASAIMLAIPILASLPAARAVAIKLQTTTVEGLATMLYHRCQAFNLKEQRSHPARVIIGSSTSRAFQRHVEQ